MIADRWTTEAELLRSLRAGDASAFAALVAQWNGSLLRFARTFTRSHSLAEDIVQETWLGVIRGLNHFEGRSSLRTWTWSILVHRARTLVMREARRARLQARLPVSSGEDEWQPGRGRAGLWEESPTPWPIDDPAELFLSREALGVVEKALGQLPESQRQTVLLRDVEDVSAPDVCNILGISETNQRVLLHRGRAAIRRALDEYLRGAPEASARQPARAAAYASEPPAPSPR